MKEELKGIHQDDVRVNRNIRSDEEPESLGQVISKIIGLSLLAFFPALVWGALDLPHSSFAKLLVVWLPAGLALMAAGHLTAKVLSEPASEDARIFSMAVFGRFLGMLAACIILVGIGYALFHTLKVPRGDARIFGVFLVIVFLATLAFPVAMPAFCLSGWNWREGKNFFWLCGISVASILAAFNVSELFAFFWAGMLLRGAVYWADSGESFKL